MNSHCIAVIAAFVSADVAAAADLTHQGRLVAADGSPVDGTHDLTIRLWSASSSGTLLSTHAAPATPVQDGYFAVTLTGVSSAHVASEAWVGVTVGTGAELPRQPIRSVPRAASLDANAVAAGPFVLASESGASCTGVANGAISWEPTAKTVRVCRDGTWARVGAVGSGTSDDPGRSCKSIKAATGTTTSALYWIDPESDGSALQVWCDMVTDGGGWTLVTRASDTNGVGNDYEFRAAVGAHSILDRTFNHGTPADAQYLLGLDQLFVPGATTVEVQYYCYNQNTPATTTYWVRTAPLTVASLQANLTAVNPDFIYDPIEITNKDGQVTTNGKFAVMLRGTTGGLNCGNGHAGQSGMKPSCTASGQTVMTPQSVWYLTDYTNPTAFTEVTSCGPVAGNVLPYYRGEVRIR